MYFMKFTHEKIKTLLVYVNNPIVIVKRIGLFYFGQIGDVCQLYSI